VGARLLHTYPPEHPIDWRPGNSAFARRRAGPFTALTAGKRTESMSPAHDRESVDVFWDSRQEIDMHRQTEGRGERCHCTLKEQVRLAVHGTGSVPETAVAAIATHCSRRHHHRGIGGLRRLTSTTGAGRSAARCEGGQQDSAAAAQRLPWGWQRARERRKRPKSADDTQGLGTTLRTR
jgi:hypothetical protein